MKTFLILLIIAAGIFISFISIKSFVYKSKLTGNETKNFYDLTVKSIDNETINFKKFKGKKVLIVNVASKCGYTPQYKDLQILQDKFKDNLVIIGFPCNQFLSQEPGNASEIKEFCNKNYGVSFQITEKIDVFGDNQHLVYKWLTHKDLNNVEDSKVSWNFNKFLIDENGKYIKYFGSKTKPLDDELVSLIAN